MSGDFFLIKCDLANILLDKNYRHFA